MIQRCRWRPLLGLFALLCVSLPARAQTQTVDPAYEALTAGNVYVDPHLQGNVDETQLQAAAQQANDTPHTVVKIAVLQHLPPPYVDRDTYAHVLGDSLNIGKNALIVVVSRNPGEGASIVTSANLSAADRKALVNQTWPEIRQNPTSGIADLAGKTAGKINMSEYGNSAFLWLVFLVVILVVGGLVFSASRKRKQELAQMRAPIDALRNHVLSGIEYLDNYVDVLPKNNPDSDQVRLFRQAASAKYDQAVKIIDRATEVSDLQRAQGLLDRAQADVDQARRYLDRATGGTGNIPGDDALRPQPLPDDQGAVNAIPQNQRGVSFFSSRPAPLGALVPVTITVNGQSRQVLVTPEEADELRHGRMPQVRAFQVGGRYVPWYEYQGYDPYRDYWAYQNSGWSNFGAGIAAGFIGAELLDTLMAPAYMPYAFATDNAYYQGYSDAVMQQGGGFGYGGDFGSPGYIGDYGGGNFGNAPDYGSAPQYDDTAGVNFNDNPNADFGNPYFADNNSADFGGNDFGNTDFGGGGDFGADFGGGDFGGGGGDSGGSDF